MQPKQSQIAFLRDAETQKRKEKRKECKAAYNKQDIHICCTARKKQESSTRLEAGLGRKMIPGWKPKPQLYVSKSHQLFKRKPRVLAATFYFSTFREQPFSETTYL